MANPASLTPLHIFARVTASLLGSWAFVWGFVTLCVASLVALGQSYGDAYTLAMLLAFLVFLAAFCWSFAAASVARVWAVLAGGGAAMTAVAWWLASSLV